MEKKQSKMETNSKLIFNKQFHDRHFYHIHHPEVFLVFMCLPLSCRCFHRHWLKWKKHPKNNAIWSGSNFSLLQANIKPRIDPIWMNIKMLIFGYQHSGSQSYCSRFAQFGGGLFNIFSTPNNTLQGCAGYDVQNGIVYS